MQVVTVVFRTPTANFAFCKVIAPATQLVAMQVYSKSDAILIADAMQPCSEDAYWAIVQDVCNLDYTVPGEWELASGLHVNAFYNEV
jgi:hypothetical protein